MAAGAPTVSRQRGAIKTLNSHFPPGKKVLPATRGEEDRSQRHTSRTPRVHKIRLDYARMDGSRGRAGRARKFAMEMSSNNESSMRRGDVVLHKRVPVYFPACRAVATNHRRRATRVPSSPLYERGRYEASNAHLAIESTDLPFVSRPCIRV